MNELINNKDKFIHDLAFFVCNTLKIKDKDFYNASKEKLYGKYGNLKYKGSFGVGKYAKIPWIAFLGYGQEVQKGIYPVILFNTETDTNNFEICYGISETNSPEFNWNFDLTYTLKKSRTKKYPNSFIYRSYSINSLEDYTLNKDSILKDLNKIINDFCNTFQNNNKKDTNIDEIHLSETIKNLYWYQVIGLSMYLNGQDRTYKVLEIEKQPIVVEYAKLKESQNVYLTLSGQLQIHTSQNSKTVNYTKKAPPAIFDKDENAQWFLTEEGIKYIEENLSHYIAKLNNPKIYKEKRLETHYWIMSAGEKARFWEDFKQNSIIAIGWDYESLGDLSNYSNKQEIKEKLMEYNSTSSNVNNTLALWQFANEMQVGDIVFIKNTQTEILGRGIVKSNYIYDEERKEYKHTRKVEWTNIETKESDAKWPIKTLTDMTPYTEEVEKLENLYDIETQEQAQTFDKYTKEDFINDVFMDENQYNTLKNLLLNKKNIILQGAPGVGKTYTATRLCYSILGEKDTNKVKMIQFHQSYGYEDFIMGYRPSSNGFELKRGPFYDFCKKAQDDTDNKYFFIIDEINRGKLSKIFGELLMLIEPDKRGQTLRLLYKDEEFSVPKNLYIIGMMNTADRSIAMIDYALRRRFAFYEFKPAFETDSFQRYKEKFNNEKYNALINVIYNLNKEISNDCSLGSGFQIGHSYFCNNKEINDEWLNCVVEYEIIPLLKEYWFDEQSRVVSWSEKLKSAIR